MKEFFRVANKVLRIKKNHPVVTRVKKDSETTPKPQNPANLMKE
jgi:hypothetical protein